MKHIGTIIRQNRRKKNLSAEFIAAHLKNPITKQAFAKKERTGKFSYDLVSEVAILLGYSLIELENQLKDLNTTESSTDEKDSTT